MTFRSSCSFQKFLDSASENRFLPDFTFPDNHGTPAEFAKLPPGICVSRPVPREFWFPKRALRSRLPILSAAVLVPEAPVDEDYLLSRPKDKIGITRQVTGMETISVAHAMDQPPDCHFRFGISISDTGHAFATLCRSQRIVSWHVIVLSGPRSAITGAGPSSRQVPGSRLGWRPSIRRASG